MLRNTKVVKRQTVEQLIQLVRRPVCGGLQILRQQPGTFRTNQTIKENGYIGMPLSSAAANNTRGSKQTYPNSFCMQKVDIKLIQAKQQQAEMRRNHKEE